MEHIFHIFGGGCGEHMLIPALASVGVSLTMARHWLKARWATITTRTRGPK